MWLLVWLALTSSQEMETYHLGNFTDKDSCVKAMSKATVLITNRNQTLDCFWVKLLEE